MGKWLMIIGVIVLLVGAALQFAPWLVNWFGRLPGPPTRRMPTP